MTDRVRRFRNDTDASIAWNGHAIPPHQDIEFFGPDGDLVLADGIVETTGAARFPAPAPPPVTVADELPDTSAADAEAVEIDDPLPPPVESAE